MRVNVNVYNHRQTQTNPLEQLLMMAENNQQKHGGQHVKHLDIDEPLDLSQIQTWLKVTLSNLADKYQGDSADFHNLGVLIEKLYDMASHQHQDKEMQEIHNVKNVCCSSNKIIPIGF